MNLIAGIIIVIVSVIGGYLWHHGNLAVLWQPNELLIIGGAGVGSFVIGAPTSILKKTLGSFKYLMKSSGPYSKNDYLELLMFLYGFFKHLKTKGILGIETHIEEPEKSDFFTKYPSVLHNHHAVVFFCDYIRLLTMGFDNHYKMEEMMEKELEAHHNDYHAVSGGVQTLADAFPALGIVAAVLGVIITMGSITEPPEILGRLIGGALVGTFLGVLLSYGIFGPMASFLGKYFDAEGKYMECLKTGIIAHIQGNAPVVSVEFVRKLIPESVQPTFKEVEEAVNKPS